MHSIMIFYFIFIIVISLILLFLISKSKVKRPMRFIIFIVILITLPVIIQFFFLVYVSPLPETVVPDVVGLEQNEATLRIEKLGLSPRVEARGSQSSIVTGQRPEPGKVVKIGRPVFMNVGMPGNENATPQSVVITPNMSQESVSTPEVQIEVMTGESR